MAPLAHALHDSIHLRHSILVTGQHRSMLDGINSAFGISPQFDLDLMRPDQSLATLTSRAMDGVASLLNREPFDAIVVHGDTSTSTAAAMAGFLSQVPIFHLEAGLRSNDLRSPFPEEGNRRVTAQLANLHLAPTELNRRNLERENIPHSQIAVIGNTVIDALLYITSNGAQSNNPELRSLYESGRPLVVVTAHRRESHGAGLQRVALAIRRLAMERPDTTFLLPLHGNPAVRQSLVPGLEAQHNVLLTEPLDYVEFALAMKHARLVITDSGGVQEEAPSLGVPVLVIRDVTERTEAVTAGTVVMVGTDPERIWSEATSILDDPLKHAEMSRADNPYGDGRASIRAVAAMEEYFNLGERLTSFTPGAPARLSGALASFAGLAGLRS